VWFSVFGYREVLVRKSALARKKKAAFQEERDQGLQACRINAGGLVLTGRGRRPPEESNRKTQGLRRCKRKRSEGSGGISREFHWGKRFKRRFDRKKGPPLSKKGYGNRLQSSEGSESTRHNWGNEMVYVSRGRRREGISGTQRSDFCWE